MDEWRADSTIQCKLYWARYEMSEETKNSPNRIGRSVYTKSIAMTLQNIDKIYGDCVVLNFVFFDQPVCLVPHLVPHLKRVGVTFIIKIYSIKERLDTFFVYDDFIPNAFPCLKFPKLKWCNAKSGEFLFASSSKSPVITISIASSYLFFK